MVEGPSLHRVVRWEVSPVAWEVPSAYFITQPSMKARFGD